MLITKRRIAQKKIDPKITLKNKQIVFDLTYKTVSEIDESAQSDQYDFKVHEYCDRWCAKCSKIKKCYFNKQQELAKNFGEQLLNKTGENLLLSARLVFAMAEVIFNLAGNQKREKYQRKVNLNQSDFSLKDFTCFKLALDCGLEINRFLKEYISDLQQYQKVFKIVLTEEEVKDEIETLAWYYELISSSIERCLRERNLYEIADAKDKKEIEVSVDKIIELVQHCFRRSKNALESLIKKREGLKKTGTQLLELLNQAELSFKEEFGLIKGYNIFDVKLTDEHVKILEVFDEDKQEGLNLGLKYLEEHKDDFIIYGLIGDMYSSLGYFNEAIEYLKIGAHLNPNDSLIFFLLGFAYSKIGELDQSLLHLKRSEELDPENLETKRNIGWVMALIGFSRNENQKILTGKTIISSIVNEDPENVLAIVDLAQIFLMENNFNQACTYAELALSLQPDDSFVKMVCKNIYKVAKKNK